MGAEIRFTSSLIYKSLPFLPQRVFVYVYSADWLPSDEKSAKTGGGRAHSTGFPTNSRGPTGKSIRFSPPYPSKYLPSLILGKSQFGGAPNFGQI